MDALEIADLLEYSAIGNLDDFAYVADAIKELRRLFVVEAELAMLRARTPVAWRIYCPSWADLYGKWNECKQDDADLEYYKTRPDCYIEYAYELN